MDFSSASPPPGGKLDAAQRDQLMDQVKQQIALANAQELLKGIPTISWYNSLHPVGEEMSAASKTSERMSEKCFRMCVTKPGSSLDNSQQKCVAMCMDRYMDAWNLVSRTYTARLQKERPS